MVEIFDQGKNFCRIKKAALYDLGEVYQILRQHPCQSPHGHQINNIFVLKSFEPMVVIQNINDTETQPPSTQKMRLEHCREADLGRLMGLGIKEIQYSENGDVFLDPLQKSPFLYQNLRAGNFNTVHLLIE